MEIDNSNRDDERRSERRKVEARHDADRRHKAEPMRTFEAKLSEKTSAEEAAKKSQQASNREQNKTKDDKEKILKKILDSSAKNKSDLDQNARVKEMEREFQKEGEEVDERFEKHLAADAEDADVDESMEEKQAGKTQDKNGEISEEGYRRVAEKQDGGQDSGGSFGGGDSSADSGEQGFGSDSSGSDSQGNKEQQSSKKLSDLFPASLLTPLGSGTSSGRGFQQDTRDFESKDLDEIVDAARVGVNLSGEAYFEVELSDAYFQGLKLMATRTPEGVVLKFDCPNVAVRSTFIRHRPKIYAALKAKNISVFRVDVI